MLTNTIPNAIQPCAAVISLFFAQKKKKDNNSRRLRPRADRHYQHGTPFSIDCLMVVYVHGTGSVVVVCSQFMYLGIIQVKWSTWKNSFGMYGLHAPEINTVAISIHIILHCLLLSITALLFLPMASLECHGYCIVH